MTSGFSGYATVDLLRMIYDGEDHGEDFRYKALWAVLGRWRKGIDLEPLIELLQSERSRERSRAAWYLAEACPPVDLMADAVIDMADDPISRCRWGFVEYVTDSGLYNDAVADRLAACLLDSDLYVRVKTILWAVVTGEEEFADFSNAVSNGAGTTPFGSTNPKRTAFWRESERRRAVRGIEIAQRLRAGDSLKLISESIPSEDSYCFDHLTTYEHAIKSSAERRAARVDAVSKKLPDA